MARGDGGTAITYVLATIDGCAAVENLLPPGAGNGEPILPDYVTICKCGIVNAYYDNDFLVSAPPLESNDAIGVPLVQDIDVVAAYRA